MTFSFLDASIISFIFAAIGLLGSPGPAIVALLAVGKIHGVWRGLWFNGGLQLGLAIAAAISAAGFVSIISTVPGLSLTMTVVASLYLIYLAWKIATAPIGQGNTQDVSAMPQ